MLDLQWACWVQREWVWLKRSFLQPEACLERGQKEARPLLVEAEPKGADDQASALVV
jgi:hypothetical protein